MARGGGLWLRSRFLARIPGARSCHSIVWVSAEPRRIHTCTSIGERVRSMRKLFLVCLVLLLATQVFAQVQGAYIESRSADIYTGQCFANGETGLVGDQAILGWSIEQGKWDGVALDGLGVVGVVKARATLGDPYGDPYPAKSVLIVDDRANAAQRKALVSFARHMGGRLFEDVVEVKHALVEVALSPNHHGPALLRAGNFATVLTRSLNEHDHLCGNEITFYPPLTATSHAMPAVAVTDRYSGGALGVSWESHGRRSAFVGTFDAGAVTMAATYEPTSQSGGH